MVKAINNLGDKFNLLNNILLLNKITLEHV